jgi:hypothetical protein
MYYTKEKIAALRTSVDRDKVSIPFAKLSADLQELVRHKYVVPDDTLFVYCDVYLCAYEMTRKGKNMLQIRKESLIDGGFHSYARNN